MTDIALDDLTRPIIGIESRTAQEVFDIMCDRFSRSSPSRVVPANPAQVTDARPWPLAGYAPGNYTCRCLDCGEQFTGDKRAINCLECAVITVKSRAAIGAGGQAVACKHDWEKTREDACMFVCSKCRVAYDGNVLTDKPEGWTGKYQGPSSALSQPHPADERVVEALKAGWNACRKSVYAVCESVDEEADEARHHEGEHAKGYAAGMARCAKSIARGFNSMEAEDDDNFRAVLSAKEGRKNG